MGKNEQKMQRHAQKHKLITCRNVPSSYSSHRHIPVLMATRLGDPQAPTHVLVVPRRHIETLNHLQPGDDAIVGELVRRAAAIAEERGISASGFRTVFNTNRDAGQTVFHIHLHLLGGRARLVTVRDGRLENSR